MTTHTSIPRLGIVHHTVRLATLLFAVWLHTGVARAGVVFIPGALQEDGVFQPAENAEDTRFVVRYASLTADINDGRVTARLDETLDCAPTDGQLAGICLAPLPPDTSPDEAASLYLYKRGADSPREKLPATLLPVDKARAVYEAVAKATRETEILSLAGRPALMVEGFRPTSGMRLSLELRGNVHQADGLSSVVLPTPATHLVGRPVARLTMAADISSKKPLRSVFSPSHGVRVERDGLFRSQVRFAADQHTGAEDFTLHFVADTDPLGLRLIAHRAEAEEDGYFMLLGNPSGSETEAKPVPKDILFVLDTSGSMRGEKLEQARAAIEYCLRRLNDGDRFNIVTFGTEVASFRPAAVERSPEMVEAAAVYLDEEVIARGRTNISGALVQGLTGPTDPKRPRMMIFLTDGTPTAGELVPENILKSVTETNTGETKVFVMGVGHDVNAHLLDRLAEETGGSTEYVGPEEEIDVKVAGLFNRLSDPFLSDVEVAFGTMAAHAVYPKRLPTLFKGTDIVLFGRYRGGGTHTLTLKGTRHGEAVEYTCTASLPDEAGRANEFVAPLWASRKIGSILKHIRLHGENEELVAEVVALSKAFGIVTEYTEFIVTAKTDITVSKAKEIAAANMRKANEVQTGQWAVSQAWNDSQLQQRMVANQSANSYVDRRGRTKTASTIRQIGRRVFYQRDGEWVDAEDAGKRQQRVVKLFSDEYFDLLRTNSEFAEAQALGSNVTINVGNERIQVR